MTSLETKHFSQVASRFTGFWWQPRGPGAQEHVYTLLYEEVDEGGVEIVRILGFPCTQSDLRPDVEEFRYPRADMPNAVSSLRLLRWCLNNCYQLISSRLPCSPDLIEICTGSR